MKTASSLPAVAAKMAERFGVSTEGFWDTLKATAFKQRDGSTPSNEQMLALLVVANQYGLNPWTKEIYAFPDKNNGIVPVVGVDGWVRIINQHPQFDGIEFAFADKMVKPEGAKVSCPEWVDVTIYRKDRTRPTTVREYLDEVYRAPFESKSYKVEGPWQTHTKRFLRHKGLIQCARLALGFVGIYDQDEAERIIDSNIATSAESAEPVLLPFEELQSALLPTGVRLSYRDGFAIAGGNTHANAATLQSLGFKFASGAYSCPATAPMIVESAPAKTETPKAMEPKPKQTNLLGDPEIQDLADLGAAIEEIGGTLSGPKPNNKGQTWVMVEAEEDVSAVKDRLIALGFKKSNGNWVREVSDLLKNEEDIPL